MTADIDWDLVGTLARLEQAKPWPIEADPEETEAINTLADGVQDYRSYITFMNYSERGWTAWLAVE